MKVGEGAIFLIWNGSLEVRLREVDGERDIQAQPEKAGWYKKLGAMFEERIKRGTSSAWWCLAIPVGGWNERDLTGSLPNAHTAHSRLIGVV